MALTRAKYRRVTDLYTVGTELVLKDGTVMWLQVLNPFERDEATRDAQLARTRLILALKSEHASDERDRVMGRFATDGRDNAIQLLSNTRTTEKLVDFVNELRDDPEWKERLEILDRNDAVQTPAEPAEQAMINQINADYVAEITRRQDVERDYQVSVLSTMTDDELAEAYVDLYIQNRGSSITNAEYALTEAWFGARVCEGVKLDGDVWDHGLCEGHALRVYETKAELRAAPEELQDAIGEAMQALNMSVRDARFSARQGSSSASSPLPSEEGESTPSTQTAIPSERPGT